MSQLTDLQTGTNNADLFSGNIDISITESGLLGIGILDASIFTFQGADTIEGLATVTAFGNIEAIAYGIQNSTVKAGENNDIILAKGSAKNDLVDEPDILGDPSGGPATGYGAQGSSLLTSDGSDTITISGEGRARTTSFSYGLFNSWVSAGNGQDVITINALSTSKALDDSTLGRAYGADNSVIEGNNDNDVIILSARGEGTSGFSSENNAIGIGIVNNTMVAGGMGNDAITISGFGLGAGGRSAGAGTGTGVGSDHATVDGGNGDDTIVLKGESGTGFGAGARNNSLVDGGSGNDNISISGAGRRTSSGSSGGFAYGLLDSVVLGGEGNDAIQLNGQAGAQTDTDAYGTFNSTVRGGTGNDNISASSSINFSGAASIGRAYGIHTSILEGGLGDDVITLTGSGFGLSVGAFQSTVNGGEGNDTITIQGLPQNLMSRNSFGTSGSTIDGGNGNDTIVIKTSASGTFDLVDTLIFGGRGHDVIDAGVGSGSIDGGSGRDRMLLNFFDDETMDIIPLANGSLQISGSLAKNGSVNPWSQTIVNVEQFQIGDIIYSAHDLIATLTAL